MHSVVRLICAHSIVPAMHSVQPHSIPMKRAFQTGLKVFCLEPINSNLAGNGLLLCVRMYHFCPESSYIDDSRASGTISPRCGVSHAISWGPQMFLLRCLRLLRGYLISAMVKLHSTRRTLQPAVMDGCFRICAAAPTARNEVPSISQESTILGIRERVTVVRVRFFDSIRWITLSVGNNPKMGGVRFAQSGLGNTLNANSRRVLHT